jgi:hypothetical protein
MERHIGLDVHAQSCTLVVVSGTGRHDDEGHSPRQQARQVRHQVPAEGWSPGQATREQGRADAPHVPAHRSAHPRPGGMARGDPGPHAGGDPGGRPRGDRGAEVDEPGLVAPRDRLHRGGAPEGREAHLRSRGQGPGPLAPVRLQPGRRDAPGHRHPREGGSRGARAQGAREGRGGPERPRRRCRAGSRSLPRSVGPGTARVAGPRPPTVPCPCGSGLRYPDCCGRWHDGPLRLQAPDAEALMRSRYAAFALRLGAYLDGDVR